MGFGVSELLILLVIVALLFGTKKLRNMGGDIGGAVKSFKKALSEPEGARPLNDETRAGPGHVIEGEAQSGPDHPAKD